MKRGVGGVALLALSVLFIAACGGSAPTATSPTPTLSPVESSPSPEPAREWWALYQLNDEPTRTTRSYKTFRHRPSDGMELPVGSTQDRRRFAFSPDGRLASSTLVREESSELSTGRSEDLADLNAIVTSEDYISSVVWAGDSVPSLFYVVSRIADDDSGTAEREWFYAIQTDGTNKRLISSFDPAPDRQYLFRTLLAHNAARNELIWFEQTREGAGGATGLFATEVATGKTRSLGLEKRVQYNQWTAAKDGSRYFTVRDSRTLIAVSTADGKQEVLYRADGREELSIEHLATTPDGTVVAFQVTEDPFAGPGGEGDKLKTTTYLLRLADDEPKAIYEEEAGRGHYRELSGLSPDATHVWLATGSELRGGTFPDTLLVDVATGKAVVIAKGDERKVAFVLGWISLPA